MYSLQQYPGTVYIVLYCCIHTAILIVLPIDVVGATTAVVLSHTPRRETTTDTREREREGGGGAINDQPVDCASHITC